VTLHSHELQCYIAVIQLSGITMGNDTACPVVMT